MLQGNPLLATWATDGTLRIYEMSSDQFVPLGVVGGLTHDTTLAPAAAHLFWDEDVVSIMYKPTSVHTRAYDILGNLIADHDHGTPATRYLASAAREPAVFAPWADTSSNTGKFNHATSVFDVPGAGRALPGGRNGKTGYALSPDAQLATASYVSGGNNIIAVFPAFGPIPPTYTAGATKNVAAFAADTMRITRDNAHVLAGKVGETSVRVFAADTLTELPTIPLTKPLRAISVAPYGRLVAISTLDSGVYETLIYRKVGDLYQLLQTLPDMGAMLTFSGDGTMLFDAGRRKSFRWDPVDNEFDLIANSMNNVTVGSAAQAVSMHVPVVATTASFYQVGTVAIANQAIDTDALRFTLMTSAAPAFNPAAATATVAMGGGEVSDGFWPAGGYDLENFSGVASGVNMAKWLFTNIEHIVLMEPLVFRSALVYMDDGADGLPLFRIDFAQDITIAMDYRVEFDIDTDGLLIFTP